MGTPRIPRAFAGMEQDITPTDEQIKAEPLLQLFRYTHLVNTQARATSRMYCALALVAAELPRNPERFVALRKLRESKDAAVTAIFWAVPA